MSLTSLLERFRRGATGAEPGARAPSASDVEVLRTRARRRLIGMVVLVGAGVLGFPWLFETQPRPMSPDIRIVQAETAASVGVDATSRAASGRVAQLPRREAHVLTVTPPTERVEPPPVSDPVRPPRAEAQPVEKALRQPEKPSNPESSRKPAEKAADKKPETPRAEARSDVRYVVQFGAFADVNAARETRQKAERMGLKTYAQQVETPQGKRFRVRLGPFADKAEAEKALATLRKGGLTGAILTL